MINFEWYRTFTAIYQQGNLTRAAHELSISQPNASVHLAALEQYVGGRLFDRLPRKMIPTDLGKQLYTQVVGSIENLSSVELSFRKKSLSNQALIQLGSPLEFFHTRLAPRMNSIKFQIHVSFGVAKDLLQQLSDGELDFVIASQKTIESKHIIYEPILIENFVVIGNGDIDKRAFYSAEAAGDLGQIEHWLLNQEWYAYSSDLAYIRRFWLKNFNKRPMITPKYIIPDLNAIIKSIAEGSGVSVVPDFLAKDLVSQGKLIVIWEGLGVASNILYLAYDKSKMPLSKVQEILSLVKF